MSKIFFEYFIISESLSTCHINRSKKKKKDLGLASRARGVYDKVKTSFTLEKNVAEV